MLEGPETTCRLFKAPQCSKPATSNLRTMVLVLHYPTLRFTQVGTTGYRGQTLWSEDIFHEPIYDSAEVLTRSPWPGLGSIRVHADVETCLWPKPEAACGLGHQQHQILGRIWQYEGGDGQYFGDVNFWQNIVSGFFWTMVLRFQSISSLLSFRCGLPSTPVVF